MTPGAFGFGEQSIDPSADDAGQASAAARSRLANGMGMEHRSATDRFQIAPGTSKDDPLKSYGSTPAPSPRSPTEATPKALRAVAAGDASPAGRDGPSTALPTSTSDHADPDRSSPARDASESPSPLDWEIVEPAGKGRQEWDAAIALEGERTDDVGQDRASRQLGGGAARSSLQTGPKNPLILPPEIASVVYVADCSDSMSGRKFRRLVDALADAAQQMNDDQQFAVLFFNSEAMQIRGGGYRHATEQNATALRAELAKVSPNGGTDPTDALLLAIQLKPKTVVVLSDGEFDESVVHRVTRLNRSSGLNSQINCVAIGSSVSTLRLLASLNGPGNYVEVR